MKNAFLKIIFLAVMMGLGAGCSQRTIIADPGISGEDLDAYVSDFFSNPGDLSTQSVNGMISLYDAEDSEIFFAEGCSDASACPMGSAYSVMPLFNLSWLGAGDLDALFLDDARVTLLKRGEVDTDIELGLIIEFLYISSEGTETIVSRYFSGQLGSGLMTTDEITQRKKFEMYLTSDDGSSSPIRIVTHDITSDGLFANVISLEVWEDDPAGGDPYYHGKLSTLVGFF
tara:strand:+ start:16658 stop:17344 length:687 start_codon:yes stop_codon:yes gene_type:complete